MIENFSKWLGDTSLSHALGDIVWFVPLVQTLHILCVAIVLLGVGTLAFKLLGLAGRARPFAPMAAYFLPWIWRVLIVMLMTGIFLTIVEPDRELLNIAFRLKMLMVIALVIVLRWVRLNPQTEPSGVASSAMELRAPRTLGLIALLLTVSIVIAGRLIAYV